jgi:hypothetical protein
MSSFFWTRHPEHMLAMLDRHIQGGKYVSGTELASCIESFPGKPLPDSVRAYLVRYLRGQVRKPAGRPRDDEHGDYLMELVEEDYRALLAWFRAGQNGGPPDNWDTLNKFDPGPELPPYQRACTIVQQAYLSEISPERVLNLISSRKRRRHSRE